MHLVWVADMFLCTVFWWWVEFRLQNVETWTFPIYFFVICLAFYVYLICAILFPKDLEGYTDYKDYFLRRRRWFFGLLIGWLALDLVDVWIKGADHASYFSTEFIVVGVILLLLYVAGIISRNERVQAVIAVATLANQISWVLRMFNTVA